MRMRTIAGLLLTCLGLMISTVAGADATIVWRPSNSRFYIDYDQNGVVDKQPAFGISTDIPLIGDINNSGSFDLVLFRNGVWYADTNRDGTSDQTYYFGAPGDVPLLADFTRPGGGLPDGKADLVVFRNGVWYVSGDQGVTVTKTYALGTSGDKPVVGDANGDGVLDIAVFRNGIWYVSTDKVNVNIQFGFGAPGDIPLFFDWNNDGLADACVFRNGVWYIQLNRGGANPFPGTVDVTLFFGTNGDFPLVGVSRYFGYVGGDATTVAQNGYHSNLAWVPIELPGGTSYLQAAKTAGIYSAIVDISWMVYCRSADQIHCNYQNGGSDKWIYRSATACTTYGSVCDPPSLLQYAFEPLHQNHLLNMVVALYAMDEPDLNLWPSHANDIVAANAAVRSVMAGYPELHATKLAVVYGAGANYATWHIEQYDWVGFDDYGSDQWIFTNGEYANLKSHMTPKQRVLLVPGGGTKPSEGVPPNIFTNSFAYTFGNDLSVIGMTPFIWQGGDAESIGNDSGRTHDFCVVGAPIKGILTTVC